MEDGRNGGHGEGEESGPKQLGTVGGAGWITGKRYRMRERERERETDRQTETGRGGRGRDGISESR